MKRLLAGLTLFLTLGITPVFASPPVFSKRGGATGVHIPLFGRDKTRPAASLQIGSLDVGAQRHGFFRIGILPEVVAQDVTIVFNAGDMDATALDDALPALEMLAKTSAVEFRNLTIATPGAAHAWLWAGEAKLTSQHAWQLLDAFRGELHVRAARLQTSGDHAGRIIFDENGTKQELNIFKL
jgi:hypothetical protein